MLLVPALAALMALACSPEKEPAAQEPFTARATAPVEMLATPFTAEEIREVWQPGLELVMRQTTPRETTWQRWRVVAADDEGCSIEYTPIDESGGPLGDGQVERHAWTELRDHASFPAGETRRERIERATGLGTLTGWLYTVDSPESGELSELFFAQALPGAPVWMRLTQGETEILTLEQVARTAAGSG